MNSDVHQAAAAAALVDFIVGEEIVFYEYDEVVAFCEEKLLRGQIIGEEERAHLVSELLSEFAKRVARQFCQHYGYGRPEMRPPDDDD